MRLRVIKLHIVVVLEIINGLLCYKSKFNAVVKGAILFVLMFVLFRVAAQSEVDVEALNARIRLLEDKVNSFEKDDMLLTVNKDDTLSVFDYDVVATQDMSVLSRNRQINALIEMMQEKERGKIQFKGASTTILQSGRQNEEWHSTLSSSFDIFAIATFNAFSTLFFDLEAVTGNGPDAFFRNYTGLNGDAGSTLSDDGINRLNLLEAWGEFSLFKSNLKMIVGKIDLTNYFDNNSSANDETVQFISNAFINNASFAVPTNSPGAIARGVLFNRLFLQIALSKIQNTGDEIFSDLYQIAGIGYKFLPGSNFETNLRLFAYQHPTTGNSAGWGLSFDEVVFGKFNIFGRYGANQSRIAEMWGVRTAWSTGVRYVLDVKKKPVVFGAAYAETNFNCANFTTEHLVEIYTRCQLNQWAHVSPHFQMILGGECIGRIYVCGFRTHFNF